MHVEASGPATGQENMTRDIAMVDAVRTGTATAQVRLYTWEPWAVSLGRNQPESHINRDALQKLGFGLVRRPTGGRAVLHANELTYCIAVKKSAVVSTQQFYADVHDLLRIALQRIVGSELEYQTVPTNLRRHYAASGPMGAACFSSSATSEIMWGGRKVVGSAQHVDANTILQHGSILCGPGHEQLADVLAQQRDQRANIRQSIADGSATLSEIAGTSITPEDIIAEITRAFESWM